MASDSSSTPSHPATPHNDPAVSGFDPSAKWSNIWNILTGRMTPAGQDEFREASYIQNEDRDCKKCDEWKDFNMKYSPIVTFLRKNIEDLNGDLNAENIRCRRCPARRDEDGKLHRQGGGFNPDHGILICANEMRNRKHMEDTLAHEMVHAWDHLRFQVDWADLRHAACTEIRASSLSGECRWTREFFTRGNWTLTQQHQNCVRKRAIMSVMGRPTCKNQDQATKIVNEVWDSCFADTRPFDEIYK